VLATWDIRSERPRTNKPLLNGEAEKCSGEQGERPHLFLYLDGNQRKTNSHRNLEIVIAFYT
jgi:hypothetical protein